MKPSDEMVLAARGWLDGLGDGDWTEGTYISLADLLASREAALVRERDEALLDREASESVLAMTVARVGGITDGFPTSRTNFLQRIDELRDIERRRESQVAALFGALDETANEWPRPNKYDDILADTTVAAQAHDERIRAEERERCVALVLDEVDGAEEERGRDSMLSRIAAAIRARGEEKP